MTNLVDKKVVLEGIRGNLPYDELSIIANNQNLEPYRKYFEYDSIIAVIDKKINDGITDQYFATWLVLLAHALNDYKHRDLSWTLDGMSFEDEFDIRMLESLKCELKDAKYRYQFEEDKFIKHQVKDEMKVVYLEFRIALDGKPFDSVLYQATVVDNINKEFNIYVVNGASIDYNQNDWHISFIKSIYFYDAFEEGADEEGITAEYLLTLRIHEQIDEVIDGYKFNPDLKF